MVFAWIKYHLNKKRGLSFAEQGLRGAAIKHLEVAHKCAPKDIDVGVALAQILMDEQKASDAAAILGKFSDIEKDSYRLALIRLYEVENDIGKIFELYSALILRCPNNVGLYAQLIDVVKKFSDEAGDYIDKFFREFEFEGYTPEGLFYSGVVCTHLSTFDRSVTFFKRAREAGFDASLCCQAMGAALHQMGDYGLAQLAFEEAAGLSPDIAGPYVNLGKMFQLTNLDKARTCFEKAIDLDEANFLALLSLADIERAENNNELALELYERAEESSPSSKECAFSLGGLYLAKGDLDEAVYYFGIALSRDSSFVQAVTMLATALEKSGEYQDAISYMEQCYKENPDLLDANFFLKKGKLHNELKDLDASIECLQEGASKFPAESYLLNALAVQLRERGEFCEALAAANKALDLLPEEAIYIANKASIVADIGDYDKSQILFSKAESLVSDNADTAWLRSIVNLRHHSFKSGWADYERRWERVDKNQLRPFGFPLYTHTSSDKVVLVYREQGLGDEVMFSSCLRDFNAFVPNIVLECDPRLESLFRRSFDFLTVHASANPKDVDWLEDYPQIEEQIAIGSMPMYVRQGLEDFAGKSPFLYADDAKTECWARKLDLLGEGLKVGLSWRGGTYKTRKLLRSVDIEALAELLKVSGVQFVNLQYGAVGEELRLMEALSGQKVQNFPEAIEDYDETAALCCALDVVVSVQTAVVHLCGGLGVPVLCLLPEVAEWRYGAEGSSMPWYESVRLFRQRSNSGWTGILQEVRSELEQMSKVKALV